MEGERPDGQGVRSEPGLQASTLVYWASCLRTGAGGSGRRKKLERGVPMARVVRVAAPADGAIVVVVGAARVAVRADFDAALLRQVVLGLGEGS